MFSQTTSNPRPTTRRNAAMERLDISELHFADELPEGRYIELPGRGKAFVRIMQGPAGAPTVLLVHGLLATADTNWSLAMPELAVRFRVVAPDLRGHGRGMATRSFSGEECADDLAAIVETLELGRVIVVGYSLGGLVAQIFARKYPQLVAGIVLSATAAAFQVPTESGPLHLLERVVRRLPESVRRAVMMAILKPRGARCARGRWLMEQVRRHDTLAILDATAEAALFDSLPWIGSIAAPAAVIVTSLDPVVSPESQHQLARALESTDVCEVAGDHFTCIKRPREFNAALVSACTRLEREYSVGSNGEERGSRPVAGRPARRDASRDADVPVPAGHGRIAHEGRFQLEG
jgi:3-oxoadipate enol-lactonase